jgi:hypothetical protein
MGDVGALGGGEHLGDALVADMAIGCDFNDAGGVGGGIEPARGGGRRKTGEPFQNTRPSKSTSTLVTGTG